MHPSRSASRDARCGASAGRKPTFSAWRPDCWCACEAAPFRHDRLRRSFIAHGRPDGARGRWGTPALLFTTRISGMTRPFMPRTDTRTSRAGSGASQPRRLLWRRSDGRIGQRSRAGSDRRREFSRLATSRSIAALFAQPSFPDGIGIVRANCRCRIGRRAAASSGVPPRRTKQKLRRRPRAGGRCGLVIPCRHAEVSRGCGHAAARSSAGRRRRVGCWRAGGR